MAAAQAELGLLCPQANRIKKGPQLLDLTTPAGSPSQVCRPCCSALPSAPCLHLLDSSQRLMCCSLLPACGVQQSHPLQVQVKQEPKLKFMDLTASSDTSQVMDVDAQPEAPAHDEPEQTSPAPGSASAAKTYALHVHCPQTQHCVTWLVETGKHAGLRSRTWSSMQAFLSGLQS